MFKGSYESVFGLICHEKHNDLKNLFFYKKLRLNLEMLKARFLLFDTWSTVALYSTLFYLSH